MAGAMETRLAALFDLIEAAVAVTCKRNQAVPVEIPDAGLLIMYDGQPGQPQVLFSPLTYEYDHRVPIDLMVEGVADTNITAEAIRGAIGAAIVADRTLGGLCDWVEVAMVRADDTHVTGGEAIRVDEIAVTLSYQTTTPLS